MYTEYDYNDTLCHYGVKGMKWGVRRYEKSDGTPTRRGLKRQEKRDAYIQKLDSENKSYQKSIAAQKKYKKMSDDQLYKEAYGNDDYRDLGFKSKKEAVDFVRADVNNTIKNYRNFIDRNNRDKRKIKSTSLNKKSVVEAKEVGRRISKGTRIATAIVGTGITIGAAKISKKTNPETSTGKVVAKGMLMTGMSTLILGQDLYTDNWIKKNWE